MAPDHLEKYDGKAWNGVTEVTKLGEGDIIRFVDTGGHVVTDEEGFIEYSVASRYGREKDSGILGLAIEPRS